MDRSQQFNMISAQLNVRTMQYRISEGKFTKELHTDNM